MILSSYRSPKTEFRASSIEGKGRFAKEFIKKDEIVAIKAGHVITDEQLKSCSDVINHSEHQIEDHFYLAPLTSEEFDQVMCYLNHSCDPNLGMLGNIIIVAMRDIEAGEELCLDYATVFNREKVFDCRCQAAACRKTVTGKDWMRRDLQEKYGSYFSSYLQRKIHELN